MAANLSGPLTWWMSEDRDGNREYHVVFEVYTDDAADGPAAVRDCPGLPAVGSVWSFGFDVDAYAFCTPQKEVRPVTKDEPGLWWTVECVFSTKGTERCYNVEPGNPLTERPKISGRFRKVTEEAQYDRLGKPILNTSLEQLRGPPVERDRSLHSIRIEMNMAFASADDLIGLLAAFIDTVNDRELWGFNPRVVKLEDASWEEKFYGPVVAATVGTAGTAADSCTHCNLYFAVTFEFVADPNTWDRTILDEGTKVLNGAWDHTPGPTFAQYIPVAGADPTKPQSFIRFKDWNGENTRVILNNGLPAADRDHAGTIHVELLAESNMLLLGIPATLTVCP